MQTKLEQIQADIDSKNQAIEQEAFKGQQTNHDQIIIWRAEIVTLTAQLEEEKKIQEQEGRQQAQTVQVTGLKETVREAFQSVYPTEEMSKIIGLTEAGEKQQQFNAFIDEAVDINQASLYEAFNTQLAERDEKIRLLNQQGLEDRKQLDLANTTIQNHVETIQNHEKTIEDLENSSISDALEIKRLEDLLDKEKGHTFDLQKLLNDAPAIKPPIDITPIATSESLNERLASAKADSKIKLANVISVGANWVSGIDAEGNKQTVHKDLVELPSVEQVLPFQSNTETNDPASKLAETTNTALPPELPNVGESFRQEEVQTATVGLDGNGATTEVVGSTESQVTLESLHKRVKALEDRLSPTENIAEQAVA